MPSKTDKNARYDISVMTPFFEEKADVFRRSLESIYTQSVIQDTSIKVQVVLCGDSPEDPNGLIPIAREFQERYKESVDTLLLLNETNLGRGHTRNKMIDVMEWEYMAVHDADDIDTPDRLKKELEYMRAHPEKDMVFGRIDYMDEEWNIFRDAAESLRIDEPSVFRRRLNNPTMFVKMEVMKALKFGTQNRGQDLDFWVRSAIAGYKMWGIEEVLVHYLSLQESPEKMYHKVKLWCRADSELILKHFDYFKNDPAAYKRLFKALKNYLITSLGEDIYVSYRNLRNKRRALKSKLKGKTKKD